MTTFGFEHRFMLTSGHWLPIEAKEIRLARKQSDGKVFLDSYDESKPFNTTIDLCTKGRNFPTEASAINADALAQSELMKTFAYLGIGAYFGNSREGDTPASASMIRPYFVDGPRSYFDDYGFKLHSSEDSGINSQITLRDHAEAIITPGFARFNHALELAFRNRLISKPEALAYDLFSASPFVGLVDAHFMILMMALEALIDQQPRVEPERLHIQSLIEKTCAVAATNNLPEVNWDSVVGSLKDMEKRESVGQAGKRLMVKLGERQYAGVTSKKFFDGCYKVRSRLAHGLLPSPTKEEVERLTWPLSRLVCDLIAEPELPAGSL